MTGLPTVLGWYVHEWLWRGDTGALNERAQEVEAIYTSTNQEEVKKLLKKLCSFTVTIPLIKS